MARRRIIIIGGGFSGASAAVQLVRKLADPLAITVIEPSPAIGPGLAYSTDDPAFRLNAISAAHSIDVADPAHFTDWCWKERLHERDPDGLVANGEIFARRRDFGRYLRETVQAHAEMPNGSTIAHVHGRAIDLVSEDEQVQVLLEGGRELLAEMVLLAPGNPPLRRPAWASGELEGHPAIALDPLRAGLAAIDPDADVLVVGAGLTALDVIASLAARGHRGRITAISRRGLRPHAQAPRILAPAADPPEPPVVPLDLLQGELPGYLAREQLTALSILRGLRRHAAETEGEGMGWQAAFDALSMPLSRIWPRLALVEKQRALRHLRHFYDAHRFRTPPMTEARVRQLEEAGQVAYRKGMIERLEVQGAHELVAHLRVPGGETARERFGAVVNCSGFDNARLLRDDSLLAALRGKGKVTPHPTGLGIVTDMENRILGADGNVMPRARAIGPLSAGTFGDPLGVFFISAQVHRLLPGIARELGAGLAS